MFRKYLGYASILILGMFLAIPIVKSSSVSLFSSTPSKLNLNPGAVLQYNSTTFYNGTTFTAPATLSVPTSLARGNSVYSSTITTIAQLYTTVAVTGLDTTDHVHISPISSSVFIWVNSLSANKFVLGVADSTANVVGFDIIVKP